MGWSIGFDDNWQRDIGYGVPCECDHPGCKKEIDRGLAYVCGGEPYGGDEGCGLYFCGTHLLYGVEGKENQCCERCARGKKPFKPKPDIREWIEHKLTCPTWELWRNENPKEVEAMRREFDRPAASVREER